MTQLETQFMEELLKEAYGGTLFIGDINPTGMDKAQKSGVVSSLCKKNIISSTDDIYGQVAIIEDGEEVYEISKATVEAAIGRAK
jgi:hypothetical protein